ncbi:MAG: glutamine amidotransferase [Chloroflexota bacterium]|nr:glutamine amidotransferase [Chloroflexota bacterium]
MRLVIGFLYGRLMNIYGDRGNVAALSHRAEWRGIDVEVVVLSAGEPLDPDRCDLYVFGGGQDKEQYVVAEDLAAGNGEQLKEAVRTGATVLSVCGGYQLLGHYYRPRGHAELRGLSLLDAHTVAGDTRYIGNVSLEGPLGKLVGFENHSGRTYLGAGAAPLGSVMKGNGNNGEDGTEGAVTGKVYGTYLHGPILPKNPAFADLLLQQALERRHGPVELAPLDDGLELLAQRSAAARPE